jgi:hypothetical protein
VIKMQMEGFEEKKAGGPKDDGKSRLVSVAVPVIAVLAGLVAYQYGYLAVKSERAR